MIQGLFNEVSEEEMVLTIGGSCGAGVVFTYNN